MKTILIYISVLFSLIIFGNDLLAKKVSIPKLNVSGVVITSGVKVDSALVIIYDENRIVSTGYTNNRGRFELDLAYNKNYTIEFSTDDHFVKRVNIQTFMNKPVEKPNHDIKFEIDLIDKYDLRKADTFLIDFPIAILKFDYRKDKFLFSKSYVSNRYREIDQMFKESEKMAWMSNK